MHNYAEGYWPKGGLCGPSQRGFAIIYMLRGLVRVILWYWHVIGRDTLGGRGRERGEGRVKNHTFGIWSAPSLAKDKKKLALATASFHDNNKRSSH